MDKGKDWGEEERERCARDFPIAPTNYLKLSDLKQVYYLTVWKSEVQMQSCWTKVRCRQSWLLLEAVKEN